MEIIKLDGEDQQLYFLVARLVMNENVLSYNLNYPYKTSTEYCWFVATDKSDTLGFVPVKLKKRKVVINNYYIADDDDVVFSTLLREIVRVFQSNFEIESVTQIRHIPNFEQNGFSVMLRWKRYVKMKVFKDEGKRL